ncbi:MAG TPA: RNA 2',3'-cyclic phosphodiesterase [Candidatus Obscuribacterales bacterium]
MAGNEAPKKRRLFVGTFLSAHDQQLLDQLRETDARLAQLWQRKLRWVHGKKMHLTWLFLGHVGEHHIDEIKKRLATIAAQHPPTRLDYNQSEFWPSPKYARLLVLTPRVVPDEVYSLERDILTALREYLQKEEKRKYQPHITLMRIEPGPKQVLEIPEWVNLAKRLPVHHKIDCIDIIESNPSRGEEAYVSLQSFRLKL